MALLGTIPKVCLLHPDRTPIRGHAPSTACRQEQHEGSHRLGAKSWRSTLALNPLAWLSKGGCAPHAPASSGIKSRQDVEANFK